MKKLINILKNKEIMGRIVFTIMILFIFRLGAQVTVPGVTIPETSQLSNYLSGNNPLSLMNLLGGGTLQSFSIFALGVSPYISRSWRSALSASTHRVRGGSPSKPHR